MIDYEAYMEIGGVPKIGRKVSPTRILRALVIPVTLLVGIGIGLLWGDILDQGARWQLLCEYKGGLEICRLLPYKSNSSSFIKAKTFKPPKEVYL